MGLFGLLCINVGSPVFALESPVKAPVKVAPMLKWQQTELFFGLSRPNGTKITRKEWEKFAAKEIAPRFSSGFTLVNGVGQWQMKGEPVAHEDTKILLLLHPQNEYCERAIVKIIAAYKQKFTQQSVLRVDSDVRVQF